MQPLALRAYERAMELGLKLDSQFQVLNNMGILLTSMGRPADAVETFEKAAALTSGDAASDGKPAAGTSTTTPRCRPRRICTTTAVRH